MKLQRSTGIFILLSIDKARTFVHIGFLLSVEGISATHNTQPFAYTVVFDNSEVLCRLLIRLSNQNHEPLNQLILMFDVRNMYRYVTSAQGMSRTSAKSAQTHIPIRIICRDHLIRPFPALYA